MQIYIIILAAAFTVINCLLDNENNTHIVERKGKKIDRIVANGFKSSYINITLAVACEPCGRVGLMDLI